MCGVGDVADEAGETDCEPNQQYRNGALVQLKAETGIASASNPDVPEESVIHAGHPAKARATFDDVLSDIAQSSSKQYEERELEGSEASLQATAQEVQPIKIEDHVHE